MDWVQAPAQDSAPHREGRAGSALPPEIRVGLPAGVETRLWVDGPLEVGTGGAPHLRLPGFCSSSFCLWPQLRAGMCYEWSAEVFSGPSCPRCPSDLSCNPVN